ncbi:hypothetical protein [Halegenticoccus soli]|uniref:hypothetical protein n=1 Tax=Halegenticoccus soli TaxID=1985678 RepID=UPI000C6EB050|nr:hypothetical protein [Halegenticoccus soli]
MSVVPGGIDTDRQPPMTIPLRHFVVGLGFLLAGSLAGVANAAGLSFGLGGLAHVHLLLAGWVCITIMGAMTQFVPVWSNVPLHSRRLATLQLALVAGGLAGFAGALFSARLPWLAVFGGLMLLGFWTFVYNLARTIARIDRRLDVTERHFALALGFFVFLTALGYLLALDLARPVFPLAGIGRHDVVRAHATLAVFGAVLTTVFGALYQLGTMFTQTKLRGIDFACKRVEEVCYPAGVLLLAGGRLFGRLAPGRLGAGLILAAVVAFAILLGRRLHETRVERTPMLSRYAVVAASLALWAGYTAPAWLRDPLPHAVLFGPPGAEHLLAVGVVGFVVAGSLYHIVPFIVWVHRYSDRLGFDAVPLIDDLYSGRLAAIDFWAIGLGNLGIVLAGAGVAPTPVAVAGGVLAVGGFGLFAANLLLVIRNHGPRSLAGVFFRRRGAGAR